MFIMQRFFFIQEDSFGGSDTILGPAAIQLQNKIGLISFPIFFFLFWFFETW